MSRLIQRIFAFAIIAVLVLLAARSIAAEVEYHLEAGAAYGGFDSNPSRAELASDRDGLVFYPADLDFEATLPVSRSVELEADYGFQGRFYELSSYNENQHRLRLQQTWEPRRRSRLHGLEIRLRQEYQRQNETYRARGNDEELEITLLSGEIVNLGQRFDYNQLAASSQVTYDWTRWLELSLEGEISRLNYREDYSQYVDIYSLDQDRRDLVFAFESRVWEKVKLRGEYGWSARDYDEKFSRTLAGDEVPGVPARFRHTGWELRLRRFVLEGIRAGVHIRGSKRTDQFEGYWDYDATGYGAELGWSWKQGHRVLFEARTIDTDYAHATVGYDPAGPLRVKGHTIFELGGRWRFSPSVDFEMDIRVHDRDNNSPGFAYERTTVISGFRYRF